MVQLTSPGRAWLGGLLVVAVMFGLVSPAAAAAPPVGVGWESDRILRMDVTYEITPDGVLKVTETIDFQHVTYGGVLRRFQLRAPDVADESMDRVVTVGKLKHSFVSMRYLTFTVDDPRDSVSGVGPILEEPPRLKPTEMEIFARVVIGALVLGAAFFILITILVIRAVRRRKAAAIVW